MFCTKQSIGLIVFLPTIYYLFKNRKKFIKMFIGYITPIVLLLIYLLITNSLNSFINLCVLGLFDFSNSNSSYSIYYLILFIIGIIYMLYKIFINKNNISLYYGLMCFIMALPIIDYYHVSMFLFIVFYYFIENKTIKDIYYKYIIVFIISICIIWSFVTYKFFNPPVITNYNNFSLVINNKRYTDNSKKLSLYMKDKNTIYFMRGSENYFYKIINNKKLDYFDLPNHGNYGYKGINMMKEKIDNTHKV
jgi:hypothetical protein